MGAKPYNWLRNGSFKSCLPDYLRGKEGRAFTRRLLSLVLQRAPTETEIAEGIGLMARLQRRGAKPEQAQTFLCLTALNLDEFLYLD